VGKRCDPRGDPSHYSLPGIGQFAPDPRGIIDDALFGSIWSLPGLDLAQRCICTSSALLALIKRLLSPYLRDMI
jgi:hypothetical protein